VAIVQETKKRKGGYIIPDVKASYKKGPSISLATYWNFKKSYKIW
jgi:lipopolysaccharide assembly outer membrane protein LptD (OstA)